MTLTELPNVPIISSAEIFKKQAQPLQLEFAASIKALIPTASDARVTAFEFPLDETDRDNKLGLLEKKFRGVAGLAHDNGWSMQWMKTRKGRKDYVLATCDRNDKSDGTPTYTFNLIHEDYGTPTTIRIEDEEYYYAAEGPALAALFSRNHRVDLINSVGQNDPHTGILLHATTPNGINVINKGTIPHIHLAAYTIAPDLETPHTLNLSRVPGETAREKMIHVFRSQPYSNILIARTFQDEELNDSLRQWSWDIRSRSNYRALRGWDGPENA